MTAIGWSPSEGPWSSVEASSLLQHSTAAPTPVIIGPEGLALLTWLWVAKAGRPQLAPAAPASSA